MVVSYYRWISAVKAPTLTSAFMLHFCDPNRRWTLPFAGGLRHSPCIQVAEDPTGQIVGYVGGSYQRIYASINIHLNRDALCP